MNVVPERCTILAEVRQRDERAEEIAAELRRPRARGRQPPRVRVRRRCQGRAPLRRLPRASSSPAVRAAEARCATAATSRADRERRRQRRQRPVAAGFPAVNLANGTERNHEPGERVSVLRWRRRSRSRSPSPRRSPPSRRSSPAEGEACGCEHADRRRGAGAPLARLPRLPGARAWAVAQHARGVPRRPAPARRSSCDRRGVRALDAGHRDLAGVPLRARRRHGERPGRARHAAAQGRLPALLLPPPAPRGADRARPHRRAARAAASPAPAAVLTPRRGRRGCCAQPRRHRAARAARPRAAGAHVRMRAARLRGDRPGAPDVDLEEGMLRARGKGSKERLVPIGRQAVAGAARLLRARAPRARRAGARRRRAPASSTAAAARLTPPGPLQDRPGPRPRRGPRRSA